MLLSPDNFNAFLLTMSAVAVIVFIALTPSRRATA